MRKNEIEKVFFDWTKVEMLNKRIIDKIREANFQPDVIVAIQRGGCIPAVMISHQIGVREMICVDIHRTDSDQINAKKNKPRIEDKRYLSGVTGKSVLVIDDIMGTGDTYRLAISEAKKRQPKNIFSACLVMNIRNFAKGKQIFRPDFVAESLDIDWVIFPWEKT